LLDLQIAPGHSNQSTTATINHNHNQAGENMQTKNKQLKITGQRMIQFINKSPTINIDYRVKILNQSLI